MPLRASLRGAPYPEGRYGASRLALRSLRKRTAGDGRKECSAAALPLCLFDRDGDGFVEQGAQG